MGRPSIFSRDYEKKMKRRKRRIAILITVFVVGITSLILLNLDYSQIKKNLQAWVDSDNTSTEDTIDKENDTNVVTKEDEDNDKNKNKQTKSLDLTLSDGSVVKATYSEEDDGKKFTEISQVDGVTSDISPSGYNVLFCDKNQNLTMFDTEGNSVDVTKTQYVSQSGNVFTKQQALTAQPTYIWHSQVKFINDTTFIYISKLPYFGDSASNDYIWIYNTVDASERCLWDLVGVNTIINDRVDNQGISLNINGVNYLITAEGAATPQ